MIQQSIITILFLLQMPQEIRKNIVDALKDEKYTEIKKEIGELSFDDNWVNCQSSIGYIRFVCENQKSNNI